MLATTGPLTLQVKPKLTTPYLNSYKKVNGGEG